MNVLFTSAGRRVELLRAFQRSFKILDIPGRIFTLDIDPLAPTFQIADRVFLGPRVDSEDYVPTLQRICREEGVDLIVPLIDPDIPVLARNRTLLERVGATVAVVDEAAAEVISDKWLTAQFFRQLGVCTPASWLPSDPELQGAEYPLFIKPRHGSASKYTFRVNTPRELEFFSRYVPDPIVQEYLPGPEVTTDVVCGLDQRLLGLVSRQRIEVRSGEVAKGVTIRDERILEGCETISAYLPARGPITIQCLLRDGIPYFTEINARFGGGVPLGIAAGVDGPTLLLDQIGNLGRATPPLREYQAGLYVTRFDDSFLLSEQQREQLASGSI